MLCHTHQANIARGKLSEQGFRYHESATETVNPVKDKSANVLTRQEKLYSVTLFRRTTFIVNHPLVYGQARGCCKRANRAALLVKAIALSLSFSRNA